MRRFSSFASYSEKVVRNCLVYGSMENLIGVSVDLIVLNRLRDHIKRNEIVNVVWKCADVK